MSSDLGDVKRLLDAFEKSDWESVHLRVGDLDVAISTRADVAATTSPAPLPTAASVAADPAARTPPSGGPAPVAAASAPAEPASTAPGAHGTPILAPSPGILWRSPAPGEPPFVDVGHEVDTDTTVCIVELMKLMNNVHAGVTGVVTAILVDNGEAVMIGQPMMMVLETPPEMLDSP